MSFILKNFINENKPVFYHFLDGLLNPNSGYEVENAHKFIKQRLKIDNNIKFLSIRYDLTPQNISFTIKNHETDIIKKEIIVHSKITTSFFHFNDDDIKKLLDNFNNYCIVQDSSDDHATSIVAININDNLYAMSCNSGLGIKLHDNKNGYYLPYCCWKISDNFSNGIIPESLNGLIISLILE